MGPGRPMASRHAWRGSPPHITIRLDMPDIRYGSPRAQAVEEKLIPVNDFATTWAASPLGNLTDSKEYSR